MGGSWKLVTSSSSALQLGGVGAWVGEGGDVRLFNYFAGREGQAVCMMYDGYTWWGK